MGKKIKILATCLCLTPLTFLTSCTNQNKEVKLGSIQIISDISDIKLEIGDTYISKPIEIKCFDIYNNQIQCDTKLCLTSLTNELIDICIKNNQIHIGKTKTAGYHKYHLCAINEDGTITSNVKDINIFIYSSYQNPDSIEIKGSENETIMCPSNNSIDYEIIGKLNGQIIDNFDPKSNVNISIESTTGLDKDLFNNPLFVITQNDKTLSLKVSENINKNYEGNYQIKMKISLLSNPDIFSHKTLNLKLIYGLEYLDENTNFFYKRETLNSNWYLASAPSDTTYLSESNVLNEILNYPVIGIENNFCESSGIKNMITVKLPNNILFIGSHAFDGQEKMATLKIDNVETIGEYAFNNCLLVNSTSDTSWNARSIGKYAFYKNGNMSNKIFNNIMYISERAFSCIGANKLTFGKDLVAIGAEAFYDCKNLTNIYIYAINPPALLGDILGGSTPNSIKIHVPINAIQNYRNNANWLIYSQNLIGDLKQ